MERTTIFTPQILHINCNYLTTALHQTMVNHLDLTGIKSDVFAPTSNRNKAVITPNPNVYVSECFNLRDRLNYKYKQGKIYKSILRAFDVSKYDCLHAYTLFTDGNIAMKISQFYHVPYVVAIRDTDVNVFLKHMIHLRKLGIEIMMNASAVLFLSESYRQFVIEKYIPEKMRSHIMKKSKVIPNGIDDFFLNNKYTEKEAMVDRTSRILSKEIRAIYVGVISKRKNILTTQAALNILREDGWNIEFTVVGEVKDIHLFRRILHDRQTRHIPPQKKEDLVNIYRENDLFIMPSYTETFGLVYAEAMSQGLPTIYTRGQGFDGHFTEGLVGYPVDSKSPQDVASRCLLILKDYSRISDNCLTRVDKFSWSAICLVYKDLYDRIISEGKLNG